MSARQSSNGDLRYITACTLCTVLLLFILCKMCTPVYSLQTNACYHCLCIHYMLRCIKSVSPINCRCCRLCCCCHYYLQLSILLKLPLLSPLLQLLLLTALLPLLLLLAVTAADAYCHCCCCYESPLLHAAATSHPLQQQGSVSQAA